MEVILHVEDTLESHDIPGRVVGPVTTRDGVELVQTRVCFPNCMWVLSDNQTTQARSVLWVNTDKSLGVSARFKPVGEQPCVEACIFRPTQLAKLINSSAGVTVLRKKP